MGNDCRALPPVAGNYRAVPVTDRGANGTGMDRNREHTSGWAPVGLIKNPSDGMKHFGPYETN